MFLFKVPESTGAADLIAFWITADLNVSVNEEFEKKSKHINYIFSNGIDFIYEFFNLESKSKNKIFSKTVEFLGKNSNLNKKFIKIADNGFLF